MEEALLQIKNNKAPGEDGITAALIKNAGELLISKLHNLICIVWETERLPEKWTQGIIVPVDTQKRQQVRLCKL